VNAIKRSYERRLTDAGHLNDAEMSARRLAVAWKPAHFKEGNFRAWVIRIVADDCRDEFRKRKRKLDISIPDFPPEITSHFDDNIILTREKMEAVQKALLQLPHEQRLVITLREYNGLSYEEIAGVMKCSIGTVRSRLSRARIRLRDILQDRDIL
jgi:RNA polymerase sigma-70 factor (ECF subfamily)